MSAQFPFSTALTKGVNPSGERQTEIDVLANGEFVASLLGTGSVAEIASEEMSETKKGSGTLHVAMDPLDGSSNISTNNPLGSIFGFYTSDLPCSGLLLSGAAYVTYGPMLTLTFSTGSGVASFAAILGSDGKSEFSLLEEGIKIPQKGEVFGFGGLRKDWIKPVEHFVSSLEAQGLKLRYGGIFGYPALKKNPKGKLRILYEAAPMAYIAQQCGGDASDGHQDPLLVEPTSLADTTPIYLGSPALVAEVEGRIRATDLGS